MTDTHASETRPDAARRSRRLPRRRWQRRALYASPAITLLLAVAAWAAMTNVSLPFTGSYSGQSTPLTATVTNVTAATGNDPLCQWSLGSDGSITLSAPGLPIAPASTRCLAAVQVTNTGKRAVFVQSFALTRSGGATATIAGSVSGSCDLMIPANNGVQVPISATISNVSDSESGTLTGALNLTDSGDFNPAACS